MTGVEDMQQWFHDRGETSFRLPNVYLCEALWALLCTAAMSWGAWASVGGDWFTGAPLVLRLVMGALLGAIAIGMCDRAFSKWKRYRASN
ncbi:hypothetical protein [Mycobacterium avium]|uniref:hypothetical protein n=1 Tax=Mycobacterium avium TaxID=1764 RepID=UPI000B4BE19D|nr:hypothetical protein [Mycobacterium avium]